MLVRKANGRSSLKVSIRFSEDVRSKISQAKLGPSVVWGDSGVLEFIADWI